MCLAIPGQIKSIHSSKELVRKAKVAFGSINKEVYLDMVPKAKELSLIHISEPTRPY